MADIGKVYKKEKKKKMQIFHDTLNAFFWCKYPKLYLVKLRK